MVGDVIKVDKEYVAQDVAYVLKTELQRKDIKLEEIRMIKSEFDPEENALVKRPKI